jgi:hypothetical protein
MADREAAKKPQRAQSREDRLKAALKANMARRKAQARARDAGNDTGSGPAGTDKKGA